MLVNGVDISKYNAILLSKDIQTADVTIYDDWLRNALNPLYMGKQEQYKQIKVQFFIKDSSEENTLTDISNLVKQLEKCVLKFDDLEFYYDCIISNKSHERASDAIYTLDIELKSNYVYKSPVTVDLTAGIGTINVNGNLQTPAIVTLTPLQDIGSLKLTGLTKKPILINNLHANAPVAIDGENCLVNEADIDTVITKVQGSGKWMFRKYSEAGMFSPDTYNADFTPTKDLILPNATYIQQLISDTQDLYKDYAYNYLGWLRTGIYVSSVKSITFKFLHDDGVSVYLNDTVVYSKERAEDNSGDPGYPSVTLNLNAGWNTLEFLWLNHYGPGGIWGLDSAVSSLVEQLNCYYARLSNVGTVNKFPDTDMWAFPVLQPGQNNISIDSNVCSVSIQYKPRWI